MINETKNQIKLIIINKTKILQIQKTKLQSNILSLNLFYMIEIKIKGPNAQKRTIIDSLRCEFIKQKDKLYMMRFKSLPNHKRAPRNSVKIDITSALKVSTEQIYAKVLQKPAKTTQDLQKTYLDSSIQDIDPHLHLKFYQQQEQAQFNHKIKKNQRVKSMASVQLQSQKRRRLYKTIEDDPTQKSSHSSLRDYINRFFNLKQTYVRQDKQLVQKISALNAQKIQPYRRTKNFKPIDFLKKYQVPQNHFQELYNGQLSPKISRIQRLQNLDITVNRNLLKRVKRQKTIENSLIINKSEQCDKVLPLRQKKKSLLPLSQFKNSLGPWRNSGMNFKVQLRNYQQKDFLS